MAVNSNPTEPGPFKESLVACVADIADLLPPLSRRYDMTVIISALAEHVGSALKVLMLRHICDARQVRQIIKNIEDCAFLRKPAEPEVQETAPEPKPRAPDAGTPDEKKPTR